MSQYSSFYSTAPQTDRGTFPLYSASYPEKPPTYAEPTYPTFRQSTQTRGSVPYHPLPLYRHDPYVDNHQYPYRNRSPPKYEQHQSDYHTHHTPTPTYPIYRPNTSEDPRHAPYASNLKDTTTFQSTAGDTLTQENLNRHNGSLVHSDSSSPERARLERYRAYMASRASNQDGTASNINVSHPTTTCTTENTTNEPEWEGWTGDDFPKAGVVFGTAAAGLTALYGTYRLVSAANSTSIVGLPFLPLKLAGKLTSTVASTAASTAWTGGKLAGRLGWTGTKLGTKLGYHAVKTGISVGEALSERWYGNG